MLQRSPAQPAPDLTPGEVVDLVSLGENLRELDLAGIVLAERYLVGADFEGANLERADFRDSDLTGCDFTGAVWL